MDSSLDLSRWREAPRGVGYRRGVILAMGLRQLLRMRFFQILLALAWSGALAIASFGFLFSQLVSAGGWAETLAIKIGPRAEAVATAFNALVLLYPDICVRGLFVSVLWLHSYFGMGLSLLALTVLIPRLVTRDRASNAFTVYFSRPLTSTDYLLGKFGIIAGVLLAFWTGPLLCGWLLSLLLSPNRDFLIYSLVPLQRALLFNGIALVTLATLALGVSALAKSSRATVVIWIGLWIILGSFSQPPNAPKWIHRISFTRDLGEVRQTVFGLDDVLADAAHKLPLLNRGFANQLEQAGKRAEPGDFPGAMVSLGIFCVASSFVFFRKLRPE